MKKFSSAEFVVKYRCDDLKSEISAASVDFTSERKDTLVGYIAIFFQQKERPVTRHVFGTRFASRRINVHCLVVLWGFRKKRFRPRYTYSERKMQVVKGRGVGKKIEDDKKVSKKCWGRTSHARTIANWWYCADLSSLSRSDKLIRPKMRLCD